MSMRGRELQVVVSGAERQWRVSAREVKSKEVKRVTTQGWLAVCWSALYPHPRCFLQRVRKVLKMGELGFLE